jgi:hypothetical protein
VVTKLKTNKDRKSLLDRKNRKKDENKTLKKEDEKVKIEEMEDV